MKFEELLREHNVAVAPAGHHHAREGWVQFDCPFCGGGTHKYHMGYNIAGGYTNCWRCGRHRTVDVIVACCGAAPGRAAALLREVPRTRTPLTARPVGRLVTPTGIEPLATAAPHCRYLTGRGFDPETIARLWGVRACGLTSDKPWRLYIPIYHEGAVVSWTTRSIADDARQRYIGARPNEEVMSARSILYGIDYCRGHGVVVHEGPTDVWATGPGAVATMSLTYGRAQVLALSHFLTRAICFDNEPAAQRRARRLADQLAPFPGETLVVCLSGKDAATSPRGELRDLRRVVLGEP